MSFNSESVKELRRRLFLRQTYLVKLVSEYSVENGLKNHCSAKPIVSRWESGISKPHTNSLDILYMIAQDTNNSDLEFYQPPKRYKKPELN